MIFLTLGGGGGGEGGFFIYIIEFLNPMTLYKDIMPYFNLDEEKNGYVARDQLLDAL